MRFDIIKLNFLFVSMFLLFNKETATGAHKFSGKLPEMTDKILV
jgi:hypothetical protein